MPSKIDNVPLDTVLRVEQGAVNVKTQTTWAKWLNQIVAALYRPTLTQFVTFPLTADGQHSAILFQFPLGTLKTTDVPVLSSPVPPQGTAFTVHMGVGDGEVWVLYHNYSGGAIAYGLPQPMTVTILTT